MYEKYAVVMIVGGLSLSTVSASFHWCYARRTKKVALIPFAAGIIITLTGVFMRVYKDIK
jgi:hypothetical protein